MFRHEQGFKVRDEIFVFAKRIVQIFCKENDLKRTFTKTFHGPLKIGIVVSFEFKIRSRAHHHIEIFEKLFLDQTIFLLAFFWPRIGKVNVYIVDFFGFKYLRNVFCCKSRHPRIGGAPIATTANGLNQRLKFEFKAEQHAIRVIERKLCKMDPVTRADLKIKGYEWAAFKNLAAP